jgi:uncharacterized membrane protein
MGSWCCVQPVVSRLPYELYVATEQAMLRTFGRIMPVLMPLSGILVIALFLVSRRDDPVVWWVRLAAALCIGSATVTTVAVNVPINRRTAAWLLPGDQAEWHRMRKQWHTFQGVRVALFTVAFALLTIGAVASHSI